MGGLDCQARHPHKPHHYRQHYKENGNTCQGCTRCSKRGTAAERGLGVVRASVAIPSPEPIHCQGGPPGESTKGSERAGSPPAGAVHAIFINHHWSPCRPRRVCTPNPHPLSTEGQHDPRTRNGSPTRPLPLAKRITVCDVHVSRLEHRTTRKPVLRHAGGVAGGRGTRRGESVLRDCKGCVKAELFVPSVTPPTTAYSEVQNKLRPAHLSSRLCFFGMVCLHPRMALTGKRGVPWPRVPRGCARRMHRPLNPRPPLPSCPAVPPGREAAPHWPRRPRFWPVPRASLTAPPLRPRHRHQKRMHCTAPTAP